MRWASSVRWLGAQVSFVVQVACCAHVVSKYGGDITVVRGPWTRPAPCMRLTIFGQCAGPSMLPAINESGDVVLTRSMHQRRDTLQRGDVVVAISPRDPHVNVCKRIAAMEGDIVHTGDGSFTVHPSITIPKGHVWLLGDNLSNSTDSRTYGPVPLGLIQSRVVMRIWPLNQISVLARKMPVSLEPEFDFEKREPS